MTWMTQRLPTQVETGATRFDEEEIEVVETDGGWEVRNARRSRSLRRFEISFPTARRENDAVYAAVIAQYKAARGRLHTWPFRDWADYTLEDEAIGTGDGSTTAFQIRKSWTSGGQTHSRAITRPVSPMSVYKDGVLQSSGYSVNYGTGLISFSAAPGAGVIISVNGQFDTPVRFDSALSSSALTRDLEHIETLTIVEVME